MQFIKYTCFAFILLLISCNPKSQDSTDSKNVEDTLSVIEPTYVAFDTLRQTRIANYFDSLHQQGFNGVVLFREGNKLFKKAYGLADFKTNDTLTTDYSFQLASASKPLTAVAVMLLVQEGKISLDDSIQAFFPKFPYRGITLKMLLAHRSGLGNYMYFTEPAWKNSSTKMTNDDVLKFMEDSIPGTYYQPNQSFDYNNTNYALLASIVEKVSQMKFSDFMEANIFRPSGMECTKIYEFDNWDKLVNPVKAFNGYKKEKPFTYIDGVVGDKGVFSTVDDLCKLDIALRENKLLNEATKAAMYKRYSESKAYDRSYGLGWRISDLHENVVYHSGWWKCYRSYFIRDLKNDRTIIILNNVMIGGYLNTNILLRLVEK